MQTYRRNNFPTYDDFLKVTRYENQSQHLRNCARFTMSDGLVLEFGVFQGKTVNRIAKEFSNDVVFGFDSFEGLPESWQSVDGAFLEEGTFAVDKLPKVRKNVKLIRGWFEETIPIFLHVEPEPIIKFLHIDCDLYSSAYTVLSKLNSRIVPGTVIVFDELANWLSPEKYDYNNGEWKALRDWCTTYNREFNIIARGKHCQGSIVIR